MSSSVVKKPWRATWFVSSSTVIQYSGENFTNRDFHEINVTNNKGGENPFAVQHWSLVGSRISEHLPLNSSRFVAPFGPSSALDQSTSPVYPTVPLPSVAEIWARTNPSRPNVLLPVFIHEFREVPDMIRQMGRFLLHARNWRDYVRSSHQTRDLASANLAFQFGWAPLIGDLIKICNFQDAVDKRREHIDRLFSGKGLRRRITLGSHRDNETSMNGTANFGSYLSFPVTFKVNGSADSWAVVRWKPTQPSGLPPSDVELRGHLSGMHPSHILENVWEALPWSWLIDYFTNIGAVLSAGNHYLATPSRGSVMTTSTVTRTHDPVPNAKGDLGMGICKYVRKSRTPISTVATLSASLPILEAGQLSILGSLAVVKGRRTLLS